MKTLVLIGSLLLAATLWAQEWDFTKLHNFEEDSKMVSMMGKMGAEVDSDSLDRAYAHYTAANVAIALDDPESYEYHIDAALKYIKAALHQEPTDSKTPL